MKLSKFSNVAFTFDPTREYPQEKHLSPYMKPNGFWVSVDGEYDWKQWCESEEWNLDGLKVRSGFTLSQRSNVLVLTSTQQLLAFTSEYGVNAEIGRSQAIDWPRVARQYDGLIITPYLWECRLDSRTSWYYGWDCASGCIWNLAALEQVNERTEVPLIPGGYTHTSVEVTEDA